MSLTAAQVVALFESRYDYQSARTMLKVVAADAGLPSADGPFDAAQLTSLAEALAARNDRAEDVVSALAEAAEPAPAKAAPAKAAPAKPAPAKARGKGKPADEKADEPKATEPEGAEAPKADEG